MSLCFFMLNAFVFLIIFFKMFKFFTTSRVSQEGADPCCMIHQEIESRDGIDFICNLPCGIIDNIFKRLPMGDLVRTSILSKEWRYQWMKCSEMEFDYWFNGMYLKGLKLEPLVVSILRQHQGPLVKFAVQVSDLKSCPGIDEWVRLLPNNTLQDLTLNVIGAKHELTSCVCSFQQLRNLRLDNCVFDPTHGFKGFHKLVNLKLQSVGLVPERFGEFFASCSAVEQLRLIHCTAFDCLEITGPKLKFFEFHGLFRSVSFKNCPVLMDVRLAFPPQDFIEANGYSFNLVNSLSCLPALEDLKLQVSALEGLVEYGVLEKLEVSLKTLKNLHLTDMYFDKIAEISSAICFIGSCSNLQRLRITAYTFEMVEAVAHFLRSQKTSKCMNKLKVVKMQRFCGMESEMEFIKFLLASATTLEQIAITPYEVSISDGGESILNELNKYPRASPSVEIISSDK
ncbi:hypothetical protein ACS0TY_022458 [Phlomoides rotata]